MDALNFNNDKRAIEKSLRGVEEALSESVRVFSLVKHHVPHVEGDGQFHMEDALRYLDAYHHLQEMWQEFVDTHNVLKTVIGEELADRTGETEEETNGN